MNTVSPAPHAGSGPLVASPTPIQGPADRRLQSLMDTISDAALIVSGDGLVRSANRAAERLFSVPASELIGSTLDSLLELDDSDSSGSTMLHRPAGAHFPMEVAVGLIPSDGEQSHWVIIRDISREAEIRRRAQQAESQLSVAINSISDGFALFDNEDRLVICNNRYQDIFADVVDLMAPGTTFEAIARAAYESGLYCTADGSPMSESFLRARLEEHRRPSGCGFLHRSKEGNWIQSREFRLPDGGTVGIRSDITPLKERELELNTLHRRLEMILNAAGDGILGLNADGEITFANHAAHSMLHAPHDGLSGQPVVKFLPSLASLASASPLAAVLAGSVEDEDSATHEGEMHGHHGETFPCEFRLAPLREAEGSAVSGAVMVFRNISLRKRYEQAMATQQRELERLVAERTEKLKASENRLMAITNTLVEGVLVIDLNGQIIFANASACSLLTNEAETSLPLLDQDLQTVLAVVQDGKTVAFADSPFATVLQNGETVCNDDARFAIGKKHMSVGYACAPLVTPSANASGQTITGAVLSFRNIDALKDAQKEALQASRMASVGQLAAGIAHEINTPIQYVGDNLRFISDAFEALTGVLDSHNSLLQAARTVPTLSPLVADVEEALQTSDVDYFRDEVPLASQQSMEGVAQVTRIVKSMKDFSHPGTTAKVATDLSHAIESTLTVSRNEWKHLAEIETHFDASLPMLLCHPGEINQALLNLIVNAAHAIEARANRDSGLLPPEKGHIVISTEKFEDWAEIRVADNGGGVPEAIRERIFDPFFTTKEVGKGTGQGLAICRDVVIAKHGGRIWVEDNDIGGATFILRLPLDTFLDAENSSSGAAA